MSLYSFSRNTSTYGMPISQKSYEDMAINRAKGTTQTALESARRQAQRMGINPNSGRYLAAENNAQYDSASQIAAAGTQASWDWLRNAQQHRQFDAQMKLEYDKLYNQPTLLTLGRKKYDRDNRSGNDGNSNNDVSSLPMSLYEMRNHGIVRDKSGKIVDRGWGGLDQSTQQLRFKEQEAQKKQALQDQIRSLQDMGVILTRSI